MKILVTGASGFVGSALTGALTARGDAVVNAPREGALDASSYDAVVALAGEPVAQRWSPEVKGAIRASRVQGLERIRGARVLVSASAIGFYGDRGDEVLSEASGPGSDFLAGVCVDWEEAARAVEASRTVIARFGMVLGRGGALAKMLPPFRLGLGGPVGGGRQWVSWIEIGDLVAALVRAVDDSTLSGVYNAVSPSPVRQADFAHLLGEALGRPAVVPAPAFALRLALGEMASMVLGGQRVLPDRLAAAGFVWRYPSVSEALRASLA